MFQTTLLLPPNSSAPVSSSIIVSIITVLIPSVSITIVQVMFSELVDLFQWLLFSSITLANLFELVLFRQLLELFQWLLPFPKVAVEIDTQAFGPFVSNLEQRKVDLHVRMVKLGTDHLTVFFLQQRSTVLEYWYLENWYIFLKIGLLVPGILVYF